jgi:predicted TIM-barrel fold metal-dependent hydrolase
VENNSYMPEAFSIEDYFPFAVRYDISGGAIVSGSFQATDQKYLLHALKALPNDFVGVTQLSSTVSDDEIFKLNDAGIRAVRFNLYRGGSEKVSELESFAKRIYDLVNWHVELYLDSRTLPELMSVLIKLPSYSIDHLGLFQDGLPYLYQAAELGARIKATGFMRCNFDVLPVMKQIMKINPELLLFGTDLPGTRASRVFSNDDLALFENNFTTNEIKKIFWENAASYYRLIHD